MVYFFRSVDTKSKVRQTVAMVLMAAQFQLQNENMDGTKVVTATTSS
jgi:hypothetical protein